MYAECNSTWCPASCTQCEPGYACLDGRRTECLPGYYSDGYTGMENTFKKIIKKINKGLTWNYMDRKWLLCHFFRQIGKYLSCFQ